MERINTVMAHAWMIRTFLKHAEEIQDDEELLAVPRMIFDYVRAVEPSYERKDAKEYLHRIKGKLPKLRKQAEFFAANYRRISDHTNFQMAALSLTGCVQRIEEAKIAAHARAGASNNTRIPRDSFTVACAQACPTGAIVFGDISDPESRVSKLKQQDRNYRLLQYLNVNARTSYLARIRNPNPRMPDAGEIGVASPEKVG